MYYVVEHIISCPAVAGVRMFKWHSRSFWIPDMPTKSFPLDAQNSARGEKKVRRDREEANPDDDPVTATMKDTR